MESRRGATERASRRDVAETVECRGRLLLGYHRIARRETAWRSSGSTPPPGPRDRSDGRGGRSRGRGSPRECRAGARSPTQGPPARLPAQHGGGGGGKRLPRDARGGLRSACRSARGVPGPPRRVGRSLRPGDRRPPAREVQGPALRRRGDATPRGAAVPPSEPIDSLRALPWSSSMSPGGWSRGSSCRRTSPGTSRCSRASGRSAWPSISTRAPAGWCSSAAPRPSTETIEAFGRTLVEASGPRNGDPLARRPSARRADPPVGEAAQDSVVFFLYYRADSWAGPWSPGTSSIS